MTEIITLDTIRRMVETACGELAAIGLKTGPIASVRFNHRAKTFFGRCTRDRSGIFHIEIMSYLNRHRSQDEIRQTVMHEVIHTLAGCGDHGPRFQAVAEQVNQRLGYRIATTSKLTESARENIAYKYVLKCGHCGAELKRYHRKPSLSPGTYHRACGEVSKGRLELYRYVYNEA